MNDLLSQAKKIMPQLVEYRRWLHQHPEIGFELRQTKEICQKSA